MEWSVMRTLCALLPSINHTLLGLMNLCYVTVCFITNPTRNYYIQLTVHDHVIQATWKEQSTSPH